MKLLVLGGSVFLGRAVVEHALGEDIDVTCVTRGHSGQVPMGADWVLGDRDRDDGLTPIGHVAWDAVIDVARQPGHVRRACRDLRGDPHYVFVSTGSVYADDPAFGQDETGRLVPPLSGDQITDAADYGAAKVACEQLVLRRFGERGSCIVRAGLIGGPGDPTGRSGYWPWRFAHPCGDRGEVIVPNTPDQPMQLVDVRDLAVWLVGCATDRVSGIYDAVGPRSTLGHFLEMAAHVGGRGTPLPVSPKWLLDRGVQEWMGDASLPLWVADPNVWGTFDRTGSAATDAGLTHRSSLECLADTYVWELDQRHPHGAGLSDDLERALINAWRREVLTDVDHERAR